MSIAIQIPTVLREYADGAAEVNADANDVATALLALTGRFPRLHRHLFTDLGELRPYVNVFLNQDDVRDLPAGVTTLLAANDVILIMPSVAGG